MGATSSQQPPTAPTRIPVWFFCGYWIVVAVLLWVIFRDAAANLYDNATRSESYYSHSLIVPFVSGFFIWRQRKRLAEIPRQPSNWGIVVLAGACLMVLIGDLLGFRVFGQLAVIPLVIGLVLVFFGARHVLHMWFPIAFLFFMVPIPESLTTNVTFRVKMLAAEGAVWLSNLMYLPVVREGSYLHVGQERLLVGDVCGGMRSLIALLAMGAIMSYISETRPWSRILILVVSAPIAIASNLLRITFLCVVAHFYGSKIASGWVHDVSGYLIYVVALAFMIGLELLLRKVAPAAPENRMDEAK